MRLPGGVDSGQFCIRDMARELWEGQGEDDHDYEYDYQGAE